MRFGFTAISDEAKLKCEQLGIRWFEKDSQWIIESEAYDQREQEWREKRESYESASIVPGDLKKEYSAQGTRIWKHPETGTYYYLIRDCVFFMRPKIFTDWRFTTPTQTAITYFDVLPADEQDRYRDILISLPPNADIVHGGKLI